MRAGGGSLLPGVAGRVPGALWVVLGWAMLSLPHLGLRSFIWEEGSNAELARHYLAGGGLLDPRIYGLHWVDKPPLLPWLIAALSWLAGGVDEATSRLPPALAVLATALMAHRLARRHAGRSAGLLAAAGFLACPMLLQKLAIAEPDTLVTALSFGAFLLWWEGRAQGRVSAARWLGCGLLLALLALGKGPQPCAFFALGVGTTTLAHRKWRDLPGLALACLLPAAAAAGWAAAVVRPGDLGTWLWEMRLDGGPPPARYALERGRFLVTLLLELMPAPLLAPGIAALWRERGRADGPPAMLVEALAAYGGLATLALLAWPSAEPRYAMPAAPAIWVLAALAFARARAQRPRLAQAAVAAVGLLAAVQLALVLAVMPLLRERFAPSRTAGAALAAAIAEAPAPVLATGLATNQLFYVPAAIAVVAPDGHDLPAPAWLLGPAEEVAAIARQRPDLAFRTAAATERGPRLVAARVERRPGG